MIIDLRPRGQIISRYVDSEVDYLQNQADQNGYEITLEGLSALYTKKAKITITGILDKESVLKAKTVSTVEVEFRPEAIDVLNKIEKAGIDRSVIARTGAPYHQYATKRLAKWKKAQKYLVNEVPEIFLRPAWTEYALPKYLDCLRFFNRKENETITRLMSDPVGIVGDKPPQTGTGYVEPFENREKMERNFPKIGEHIRDLINEQLKDEIEYLTVHYPKEDGVIQLGSIFRGIRGGRRGDGEVIEWTSPEKITLSSGVRKVANLPASVLHNKVLDDVAWRRQAWESTSNIMTLPPWDPASYELVRSTPPAHIPGDDPDEIVNLSYDGGWTNTPMRMDGYTVVVPEEDIGLGADQTYLVGQFFRTYETGMTISSLVSGRPTTMYGYNELIARVAEYYVKKHSLHVSALHIGDDQHYLMPRHEIGTLLTEIGHYCRGKGMIKVGNWYFVFILGYWLGWQKSDDKPVQVEAPSVKLAEAVIENGQVQNGVNNDTTSIKK